MARHRAPTTISCRARAAGVIGRITNRRLSSLAAARLFPTTSCPSPYTGSGTITPAPLTGGFVITAGIVNASKIYDGLLTSPCSRPTSRFSGWVERRQAAVISPPSPADFGQKDVGTQLALSAMFGDQRPDSNGGTNLDNYQINAPQLGIGNITPARADGVDHRQPDQDLQRQHRCRTASGNFNITGWVPGENGTINAECLASYALRQHDAGSRNITATLTPGNYVHAGHHAVQLHRADRGRGPRDDQAGAAVRHRRSSPPTRSTTRPTCRCAQRRRRGPAGLVDADCPT